MSTALRRFVTRVLGGSKGQRLSRVSRVRARSLARRESSGGGAPQGAAVPPHGGVLTGWGRFGERRVDGQTGSPEKASFRVWNAADVKKSGSTSAFEEMGRGSKELRR